MALQSPTEAVDLEDNTQRGEQASTDCNVIEQRDSCMIINISFFCNIPMFSLSFLQAKKKEQMKKEEQLKKEEQVKTEEMAKKDEDPEETEGELGEKSKREVDQEKAEI